MPFANGIFSRLRRWSGELNISQAEFDQDGDDVALALSTCLLRDGSSLPTANIPMGAKRLTGLGAPTTNGDAIGLGFLSSAEVARALGYTPALPTVNFNLVGTSQSDIVVAGGAKGYYATVDFVATASSMIAIGAASFMNNTSGSGVPDCVLGMDLLDTVTGTVVSTGTEGIVSATFGNGKMANSAGLLGTNLTIGRKYRARLYASKSSSAGSVQLYNPSINGVCL